MNMQMTYRNKNRGMFSGVTNANSNINSINNINSLPSMMVLSNAVRPKLKVAKNQFNDVNINNEIVKQKDENKIKWGEPTWFLFHTLAEKVKEDNFPLIRIELLNNIISICHNLPCPKCAKHAIEYMKKINLNSIQTKDDLKKMLFIFHNFVNNMKGYPLFEYDKLDEKYVYANTVNIIYYFLSQYNVKDFNVNMINSNMQRNMLVNKLKEWFKNNIQYFEN